jgi:kinesin family protein 5
MCDATPTLDIKENFDKSDAHSSHSNASDVQVDACVNTQVDARPLHSDVQVGARTDVQVVARFRPLNSRELEQPENEKPIYTFKQENDFRTIRITQPMPQDVSITTKPKKRKVKLFSFDHIFPETTTQQQLYKSVAQPLLSDILQGFNCTIMAYGQTGSGKTHTMMGDLSAIIAHKPTMMIEDVSHEVSTVIKPEDPNIGVIPRMVQELFQLIEQRKADTLFTVQCSYVEIYLEKIRDLINPNLTNLQIREIVAPTSTTSKKSQSLTYIEGCTICTVKSIQDILKVIQLGDSHRTTAATDMNDHSSRSHSVFILNLTQTDIVKQTRKSSKLFLVDLAGSEQVSRSGATGLTLEQAIKINKSLSTLSLVIQALTEKTGNNPHIPYRDSKLTRLLTDSLGGNSKTVLIMALSPARDSLWETYSTLRFGSRTKKIKNCARINEEISAEAYKKLVQTLTQDIETWKTKLQTVQAQHNTVQAQLDTLNQNAKNHETLQQQCQTLTEEIETWKTKYRDVSTNSSVLLSQYITLNQNLSKQNQEVEQKLNQKLTEQNDQLNNLKQEIFDTNQKNQDLQYKCTIELNQLKKDYQKLLKENIELTAQYAELTARCAESTAQITELTKCNSELSVQIANLTECNSNLTAQCAESTARYDALEVQNALITHQTDSALLDLQELTHQHQELTEQYRETLKQHQEVVQQHRESIEDRQQAIEDRKQAIHQHQQAMTNLMQQHQEVTQQHKADQEITIQKYQELTQQNQELTREYQELVQKHQELQQKHQELQREHHDMLNQHQEVMQQHKADQEITIQKYKELTQQNQELTRKHHDMSNQHQKVVQQHSETIQQNQELSQKYQVLSTDHQALIIQNAELSRQIQELQKQLEIVETRDSSENTDLNAQSDNSPNGKAPDGKAPDSDSPQINYLNDLAMFQTGNLVVWGMDNLFTFEAI